MGCNLSPFRGSSVGVSRCWVASRFEQVPGFFVRFVFLGGAAGSEEEVAAEADDDLGGEDVPDVFGDDVHGEEVDLVAGVVLAAAGFDGDDVSAVLAGDGGFDLDTEKVSAALDSDVVAGGVSPGLGDVESALGDAGHEIEFGPLAAMFGVFDDDAAAAVGWTDFVGDEFVCAFLAARFPGNCFRANRSSAAHGFGLKTQKAQAWRLRLWFPSRILSLYLYFINLGQVKWTFGQKSICFAGKGMGRIGRFYPIDTILGFWGFTLRCAGLGAFLLVP
jgi:hypothetical protein